MSKHFARTRLVKSARKVLRGQSRVMSRKKAEQILRKYRQHIPMGLLSPRSPRKKYQRNFRKRSLAWDQIRAGLYVAKALGGKFYIEAVGIGRYQLSFATPTRSRILGEYPTLGAAKSEAYGVTLRR